MKFRVLSIALALTVFSGAAGANINEAMNRQFGTMQNVTAPAVIVGPEGGVVSAGAMRMRMPIRSVTPVRMTPPSIRAGCGGIDLQGGSLSFPSAQEFVQVARAVAGNVGGYAFKLALGTMCQQCENVMSEIQELNNLFNKSDLDSCQLAQGVVDSFDDRGTTAAEASLRDIGTAWKEAFSSDRREASNQGGNKAPASDMPQDQREAAFEGNYVWQALKRSGEVIPEMRNNEETREIIMSMIGTVVVCAQGMDGCPELRRGERQAEGVFDERRAVLTLNELLDGGRQLVFDCRDERCLDLREKTVDLGPSMVRKMEDAFLKSDGILDRLSSPSDTSSALTEEQKRWLALIGTSAQGVIDLAASGQQNRAKAEIFVRDASRSILATYYANMVLDVTRQVRRNLEVDSRPGRTRALEVLEQARTDIRTDLADQGSIVSQELMLLEFRQKLMASMAARISVINATAAEVPSAGG